MQTFGGRHTEAASVTYIALSVWWPEKSSYWKEVLKFLFDAVVEERTIDFDHFYIKGLIAFTFSKSQVKRCLNDATKSSTTVAPRTWTLDPLNHPLPHPHSLIWLGWKDSDERDGKNMKLHPTLNQHKRLITYEWTRQVPAPMTTVATWKPGRTDWLRERTSPHRRDICKCNAHEQNSHTDAIARTWTRRPLSRYPGPGDDDFQEWIFFF